MLKTLISGSFKLQSLRQIKALICEIVCLEKERKYLLSECPEEYKNAKIRYDSTTTRHLNAQNKYINYRNTMSYIDCNRKKTKIKNLEEIRLQLILERLSEIENKCLFLQKSIKMRCNSINSLKSCHEFDVSFKTLKTLTENELYASNEHVHISNKAAEFSNLNFQSSLFHNQEPLETSHKNNSNLNNSFSNNLIGLHNEVYRSKNEILASICLRDVGLFYSIEPYYPDSGMRADFGVFCSYLQQKDGSISVLKKPRQVFIEIAGGRNSLDYENKLQYKIATAKSYKIPLLVIDSTDYKDENNKTIFDYKYLCDIFTKLYFGLLIADGKILTPYQNDRP